MGKRELLLIVAFVVCGAIVYQFTAPPPAAGERSFAPGQLIEHVRRAIRGNRASADVTTRSTQAVDAELSELRLTDMKSANITIHGESRSDIDVELAVHSNGFDEEEAQRLAKETALKVDRAGARMVLTVTYPEAGTQRSKLTIRVPQRLAVQLQGGGSELNVDHVSALEVNGARGKIEVSEIAGLVSGGQRGGELHIANAGAVKLSVSGTDAQIEHIRGEVSLTMRAGDLKCGELAGPLDLDTNGTDITIDRLEKTSGIVRINAVGGSLDVKGLRTEGRFDVRGTKVEVTIDRAAPLAIYSEGGDNVEVTPPTGGYQLDAVASDGAVTLPDDTLDITSTGSEHRATGPVHGGGPTITVRSRRGNIEIKAR
jgi:putative adhesin